MRLSGLVFAAVLAFAAPVSGAEAGSWEFTSPAPGGPLCMAALQGTTVDVQLVRNRDNKMILVPGHPDWHEKFEPLQLTLSIDGEAPVTLDGNPLGAVVFIVVTDDALAARIKTAKTLAWHFPWGDFQQSVDGIGAAYDKIGICPG